MKTITSILIAVTLMLGAIISPITARAEAQNSGASIYAELNQSAEASPVQMSKWDAAPNNQESIIVAQQNICSCETYANTVCTGPCDFAGQKPTGCFCK